MSETANELFDPKQRRASIWINAETAERLDELGDSYADVLRSALGEYLTNHKTFASNVRVQCAECNMFVSSVLRPCWNCGGETYERVVIDQ